MAARFGDMLLEQRRRMGLSIQQVANTIKIRPQIIEFFETGNFASMPPRGYAQGMISSYARFLGLNPREVVNAYFDDLMAYERETSQQGGRFQDAAGYVNSRSSVDNGRFLMVQGGRSTRYGQRDDLARIEAQKASGEEIRSQRDRFRSTPMPEDRALPAARGVARDPRAGYGDGGYSDRGYRGASAGRSRGGYADADTTQVTPRLRSQSQPYGQRSSAPRSGQPSSSTVSVFLEALNHSRMASALRLRVRASVAINAAVSLRPARVNAAFRARAAIAAVPIAIAVVCLREAAAAVPVVDAAGHVLLKTTGSIRVSSTPASVPLRCC